MTAPLPKHHDYEDAERFMLEAFGVPMGKYMRVGEVVPLELAVHEAVLLFSRAAIEERVMEWRREERRSNRGRRALFSEASLLKLMFVTMRARRSVSIKKMTEVAMSLTVRQREAVGILHFSPHQATQYRRLWEAIQRLRTLTDRHPGKRGERMLKKDYDLLVASRERKQMAKRHARMLELTNLLIDGSVNFLPRDVRRRFKGAVAIDATFAEVSGSQKGDKTIGPNDTVSVNFDCGWYTRDGDHDGSGVKKSKRKFGWEVEFAVMTRDPAESDFTYPLLFLATSGHKPGKTRGHGLHLYNSMRSRGIDVKTLIGDRAYFPGARVQDLQGPLAKAGVKVVMDYKTTELGIQASYNSKDGRHKLIMVGGNWYMACMPSTLVFLEQTHQARLAAIEELPEEAQSAARAKAEALATKRRNSRSKYHLKPRSNFDQTGARQYTYPTFKSDEVEFDPESGEVVELKVPGKTVKVPGNLSNRPGVLNQRHLKYHQEFEYGSDEQRAWFGQRNNVENGNSRLKDADREALGVAMKRRVRGPWFVELAAAFAAASANLARIIEWLKERLSLAPINRMNNTSPALFEAGLSTLTLDEHDSRNGFNAIAQLPEFQLLD